MVLNTGIERKHESIYAMPSGNVKFIDDIWLLVLVGVIDEGILYVYLLGAAKCVTAGKLFDNDRAGAGTVVCTDIVAPCDH